MPVIPQESTRADHSFTACDPKAWRWAVSWPKKANWVSTRDSTTARPSCHHESPRATMPAQVAMKATPVSAIMTTYHRLRRSSSPASFTCCESSA